MTKEQVDALLKLLDKLDGGTDDGDAIPHLQSTQSEALLMSVTLDPPCLIKHRILSSTLERIKDKLRDASDRVRNTGYMGGNEDAKVVSELMDEIQGSVIDCQVSNRAQTVRNPNH